jgi:hypothetical protein
MQILKSKKINYPQINADEHRYLKAWIGRAGIARLLDKYWLHFGGQCPPYEFRLIHLISL